MKKDTCISKLLIYMRGWEGEKEGGCAFGKHLEETRMEVCKSQFCLLCPLNKLQEWFLNKSSVWATVGLNYLQIWGCFSLSCSTPSPALANVALVPCLEWDCWLWQSPNGLASVLGCVCSNSQWYKLLKGTERHSKQTVYKAILRTTAEDKGWWELLNLELCVIATVFQGLGPNPMTLCNATSGLNPFISLKNHDLYVEGHWGRLAECTWDWNLKLGNKMHVTQGLVI